MQRQYSYIPEQYFFAKSECVSPKSASSSGSSTTDESSIRKLACHNKPQYQCSVCLKLFTRPSALKMHTYTHTGEKPYQCSSKGCGRRFSVVSNLRRHIKIHQKTTIPNRLSAEERIDCVRKLMKRCQGLPVDEGTYVFHEDLPRLPSLIHTITSSPENDNVYLPAPKLPTNNLIGRWSPIKEQFYWSMTDADKRFNSLDYLYTH